MLLEAKKDELEQTLASPELYAREEASTAAVRKYRELNSELGDKYAQWERLIEEQEEGWE